MPDAIPNSLFVLALDDAALKDTGASRKLIEAYAGLTRKFDRFGFAFKFSYRAGTSADNAQQITKSEVNTERTQLIALIKEHGLLAVANVWDEASVEEAIKDGCQILNTEKASFADWSLFESIVRTELPVLVSEAAENVEELDNVVAFLEHRNKEFVLMHRPSNQVSLKRLEDYRKRFPELRIGCAMPVSSNIAMATAMAIAKGSSVVEHNLAYASGASLNEWLEASYQAMQMNSEKLLEVAAHSSTSKRGLYAKQDIPAGTIIKQDTGYLDRVSDADQVTAKEWSKYNRFTATSDIKAGAPINHADIKMVSLRDQVFSIVVEVNDMLQRGNIVIPQGTQLEISHHYGVERFHEYGAALITVINRDYCKKVIVMLPGQKHPTHRHGKKDETLHVLHGSMRVNLDGTTKHYGKGEMIIVEPGMRHSFESDEGCVFEEISSTHYASDSHYDDDAITRSERKTLITYWSALLPNINREMEERKRKQLTGVN